MNNNSFKTGLIAVDLETTGLIKAGHIPEIICVGYHGYDMSGTFVSGAEPWSPELRDKLNQWVDDGCVFIFHNSNFDRPVLKHHGVVVTLFEDTMLMSYVWEPNLPHGLDSCAERHLGKHKLEKPWKGQGFPIAFDVGLQEYVQRDVILTYDLYHTLFDYLCQDEAALGTYYNLELLFTLAIQEMEKTGLHFDVAKAKELEQQLQADSDAALAELQAEYPKVFQKERLYKTNKVKVKDNLEPADPATREIDGQVYYVYNEYAPFNPNSNKHIIQVLTQLGWEPKETTAKGNPKVDEKILTEIDDPRLTPFVDKILRYKKAEKIRSTFIQPLTTEYLDPNGDFVKGHYNQCVTLTGRLSSSEPNLQNIPRHSDQGKQIRGLFTAPDGYVMFDGDLSNIEARVCAYFMWLFTGNDSMAKIFINNENFHTKNSEEWGIPRDAAKKFFFAKIYGAGLRRLAKDLKCSLDEVRDFSDRVNKACPALDQMINLIILQLEESPNHTIHTLFGRRLCYPNIASDDEDLRAEAQRQVVNALIQGSAADILKVLTILSLPVIRKYGGCLAASIHDEIVGYAPADQGEALIAELNSLWSSFPVLRLDANHQVPVSGDFKTGLSWAETH